MIKNLIYTLLIALILSSCFSDDSTYDVNHIEGVEIVMDDDVEILSIFQWDYLQLQPSIVTKLSENNLEYRWELNIEPGSTHFDIIGNDKDLNYEIKMSPSKEGIGTNGFLKLVFTVTDKNTDLEYIKSWYLHVRNALGEGLVVAHSKDGSASDISLIMTPNITTDYSETKVMRNLFSTINGFRLEGIIKDMAFNKYYTDYGLIAITDNEIYKILTEEYFLDLSNEELFYAPPSELKPQSLGSYLVQHNVLVNNGQLTSTSFNSNQKFALPFDFSYSVPSYVCFNGTSGPPVMVNFYDEVNGKFIYMPSCATAYSWLAHLLVMKEYENANSLVDPTNLPGRVNLAAKVSNTGEFYHLLKNSNGEHEIIVFSDGTHPTDPYGYVEPTPIKYMNLAGVANIDKATQYEFCFDQKVLYYAAENKIYGVQFISDVPVVEEKYTFDSSVEITTLQVYTQATIDYVSNDLETNNRLLVVSTYESNEGKVNLIPMVNIGSGNLDASKIIVYDGFDKVSAIAPQR